MRFKEFNNLWTKFSLNSIVDRVTRKNLKNESNLPLTISAQYGLINQNEFFNKQIASRDLSNYILIKKGEFAYNKSYSSEYPWGTVKRLNNYDKGVISSLYICFSPKSIVNSDFLVHYFESSKWYNEISNIAGEGARNHGLLNMSVADYFQTTHRFPSSREQQKIATFLDLIDKRIDTQSKIIEDLESKMEWIRNEIFKKNYKSFNHSLSDYLSEYTERNVNNFYTPVAVGKYGIRKREEIYSKELAADYSKNKVIRQNTLIIGMGSTQIDIGILLIDEIYCVSPAYTTYKIKNINASYLNELLTFLNPLLSKKYMIISSRQGKSVNKDELLAHKIFVHTNEIQIKIAELFHFLYAKIKKEKDILELYKKQKAYLLKNMFI